MKFLGSGAPGSHEAVRREVLLTSGHVLIADSDTDVREGIASLLANAGYETQVAESGDEALASARATRPDIVVLDIHLPGISGYEVCRRLRDEFGDEPAIVFLSDTRTEPSDRVAGLLIGADDYLAKPFSPGELLARLHRLVARLRPPERDRFGLTGREREVLTLLAVGLGRREIAKRLYISPKTVAKHIENILHKLRVHSQAQAVAKAMREKLVDPEDEVRAHAVGRRRTTALRASR